MRVKLKDVAVEFKEKSSDKSISIGLEHLESNKITIDKYDTNGNNTFTKVFKRGQILFGRRRAYLHKAAVAPFDGICSGDIIVIEAIKNKIFPDFLPFIIQNEEFFNYAVEKSAGSLSPRVKWEHLKEYEFELPDLDEQKRLANILWKIEDVIFDIKKSILNCNNFKKAIFNDIKSYKYFKMEEISTCFQPKNIDVSDIFPDGVYKVYGANGVIGYSNKFNSDKNTLIIGCRGSCGSVYLINEPSWVTSNSMVIINNEEIVLKKYLYYYFKYNDLSSIITGTAQPQIVRKILYGFEIKIPTLDIQKQIIEKILKLENLDVVLEKHITKINKIKSKIIKEALHV